MKTETIETIEQLDEEFGTAVIKKDYCLPSKALSKKNRKSATRKQRHFLWRLDNLRRNRKKSLSYRLVKTDYPYNR